MEQNILLTICSRGGSKGVKGKNIRNISGNPLISYTIGQALKWGRADNVVVSTDSDEIANVARKFKAEVPFIRSKRLASDSMGKLAVIQDALRRCERIYNKIYSVVVDLDPTSPVRTSVDIENAYRKFIRSRVSTLFSVVPSYKNPYFNMVERTSDGAVVLSKKTLHSIVRRQDAPKVYDMNASIYIFKREFLMKPDSKTVISSNSEIYIMNEWASIDIDREIDFSYVEFLVREKIISLQ